MQIAQKLYEAGHITYMRTDVTTMSEEAVEQCKSVIESKWGKAYVATGVRPKKAKDATAQEAHEAIRATHFENSQLPEREDWGVQDRKIYHLIWLRAIQSIMAPALGETRTVEFEASGDEDLTWEAKWKRTTFPGWKAADEKDTDAALAQDESDSDSASASGLHETNSWKVAEGLKEGQALQWKALKAQPQETKPQGRFTEATLVRELEKKGIGRPSTFASLIATLIDKSYVEVVDIPPGNLEVKSFSLGILGQWPPTANVFALKRGGEKSRMVPTSLGKSMLAFAVSNFPDLFAFDFTAGLESRLDKISEGKESWKLILGDTWNSYKDRVTLLKSSAGVETGTGGNTPRRREFANGLIAVIGSKGPLLLKEGATKEATVFYGWPNTKKGFQELTEQEAVAFVLNVTAQKEGEVLGDFNGHPIHKKKGPYGLYAEWNGTRVNLIEGDGLDDVIVKLKAKQENPTRMLGPFQIRTGPYGPYLMKVGASANPSKKPQYVSIPAGTDLDALTAQEAGTIFEAGLKAKNSNRKFKKK